MTTAKKAAETKPEAKNDDVKLADAKDQNDDVSIVDSGDVLTREESIEDAKGKQQPDEERTPTSIAQPAPPSYPHTVEDANGIERIVAGSPDGWEPAPVDPPEAAIKAAEEREKAEEEAKKKRLEGFYGDADKADADKADADKDKA